MKKIIFFPYIRAIESGLTPGSTVAVIDVLRATTTITAALAAGCNRVLPCATVLEARQKVLALRRKNEPVVLAGERGGLRIKGFDAGNSPLEVSNTKGKTMVLTTTNGTRAFQAVAKANWIIPACLNNLSAAIKVLLQHHEKNILVVAAGDQGSSSPEDELVAGLLIRGLTKTCPDLLPDPLAIQARTFAEKVPRTYSNIETFFLKTPHGQELARFGFKPDVVFAARLNSTRMVGRLTAKGIVPLAPNKKAKIR